MPANVAPMSTITAHGSSTANNAPPKDSFLPAAAFSPTAMRSHATIHTNPAPPRPANAHRQPNSSVSHGTRSGARIAPAFDPELKTPVANARSRFGNHSATVLMAAGKLPASPKPSRKRAQPKPIADAASACSMAAMLHQPKARE